VKAAHGLEFFMLFSQATQTSVGAFSYVADATTKIKTLSVWPDDPFRKPF
jgi:hypothetical protein